MQKDYNEQSLDKRCMSTVQLLIDIENLAHADYMTGTLNSGIPYLIEVCVSPTPGPNRRHGSLWCHLVNNAWKAPLRAEFEGKCVEAGRVPVVVVPGTVAEPHL